MADWLRAAPGRRVVIAGEMRRQSPEYALALGQQRAEAVARRLRALGVAAGQIETVSHGRTGRDGVTLQRLEPPPVSSARP
jgi:outer membrane protein OmpA-like peptidoglycan-associated protein